MKIHQFVEIMKIHIYGMIRFSYKKTIEYILLCALVILFSCKKKENCSSVPNKTLDNIESLMFQYPEHLDSLIFKIDTVNITQCDSARISMIKGYFHYWNGNYDQSINELAKSETIFQNLDDNYYINLNNMIKAFVFELLDLDNNATDLYVSCNEYFNKNHLQNLKFYSTLGLLRFSKQLNLDKGTLIGDIEKSIMELNQPIYKGLFYSALGNLEKNDSVKCNYYEIAKKEFTHTKRWNRIYTLDLNILYAKIRIDSSDKTLQYYNELSIKYNLHKPTAHQKMKFRYAKAYLYAKQGKDIEAIAIANELLKEPDIIKFPDIESYCVNLLSVSYLHLADYMNAHKFLVSYNLLQEKSKASIQNSRLLALGAYYKYSELEKEKLNLKLRFQKFLLFISLIILIFIAAISFISIQLKKSNHKQEVLKLKNIEIEDQIKNLVRSLELQKNIELVDQVEKIGMQYKDSQMISRLKLEIEQGLINNWNEFETKFMEIRYAWFYNLKLKISELSQTDLKYCMCLYLDLNSSTICKLCYISADAIKSAKKRIRDKLALSDASEISAFLKQFD